MIFGVEERCFPLFAPHVRLNRGYGTLKEECAAGLSLIKICLPCQISGQRGRSGFAYSESNFSMSAWEYEAPMTFLPSFAFEEFEDAARQKGEAELVLA